MEARSAAAPIASPTPWIRPVRLITSRRRMRAPSSRASRRARPTWLWAARAAYIAIGISTPSRRWSSSATASAGGVRSRTCRERERMVMTTSSSDGAHRIHTVRATGSSIALSRASAARSVRRSASSMMMTRHGPTDGRSADIAASSRACSTLIESPSVATTSTSAWVPSTAVRHSRHSPQPSWGHSRAAANARAATDRPEPGGPGEEPGVGHRTAVGHGSLQGRDRRVLSDHVPPDGHARTPMERRRSSTWAWIASGACMPSTTM